MRSTTDTESQPPVSPPETLTWHRFTEKDRKSRVNRGSHFTVLVGIIMAIGSATLQVLTSQARGTTRS